MSRAALLLVLPIAAVLLTAPSRITAPTVVTPAADSLRIVATFALRVPEAVRDSSEAQRLMKRAVFTAAAALSHAGYDIVGIDADVKPANPVMSGRRTEMER